MNETLKDFNNLSALIHKICTDQNLLANIDEIAETITLAYRKGNKTIFCGNGGSAAEAQHLAAELSGKFNLERKPIAAEACHVNSSFVTAVSNDFNFTKVYSRYVEAFGNKGDIFIGLSTSGTSENIVNAFKAAKDNKLTTIALTGKTGGNLSDLSDFIVNVPSQNIPRIQEIHLLIGHIICKKVEQNLFGNE